MTLSTPTLEPVANLVVHVAAPVEAGQVTGLNSRGRRRVIPITGGTVRLAPGPGAAERDWLAGEVLAGGADFQLVVSDTCADLDARYVLALAGGAHIYVHNHALRRGSVEDIAKLVRGEPVDPAAIYFRGVPTFEVSDPSLAWLTESVFVGTGARYPDRVEMRFFRLA